MMAIRRAGPAAAMLGATLVAASAAAQVSLAPGFLPDPHEVGFVALGATPAADWVRGCPGFASAAPSLTVAFEADGEALRLRAEADGLAALVVAGPDGVHRCAPVGPEGGAYVRFERPLAGTYAVWAAAAVPGVEIAGALLLSELDIPLEGPPEPLALGLDAAPLNGRHPVGPGVTAEVAVQAGGGDDASRAGPGCSGGVEAAQPDVTLMVDGATPALLITATSEMDTTLLAVDPAGRVWCDDDSDGLNPRLVIDAPAPGGWQVWVGVWGGDIAEATLRAEAVKAGSGALQQGLALDAAPAAGAFPLAQEDPLTIALTAPGGVSAPVETAGCVGAIDPSRPDAVVTLDAAEPTLSFSVTSDADTTLIVAGPDGALLCNDDADGLNPAVTAQDAQPGAWRVWVGLWDAGPAAATLRVGRAAPEPDRGPFIGRDIPDAMTALQIAMEHDEDFARSLRFEALEPLGRDGFVMRGVTIIPPGPDAEPMRVAELRVTDLDLDGLATLGAPQSFVLTLDGIDYSALRDAARREGTPAPFLEDAPPLDASISVLPQADAPDRRAVAIRVGMEGEFLLEMAADIEAAAAPLDPGFEPEAVAPRSLSLTLDDMGYVGRVAAAMAAEGEDAAALARSARDGLSLLMGSPGPGDPRWALLEALSARLADLGQPGQLVIRLDNPAGLTAQGMIEALIGEGPYPGVTAAFTPTQRQP